jgi:hypothetical protein
VSAQEDLLPAPLDEERVLHVARGVVRREVQGLEVVVVELDLRARRDLEAELGEDRLHLAPELGDQMEPALVATPPGQGHVDDPLEVTTARFVGERAEAPLDLLLDLTLDAVGGVADLRALGGRERADALHEQGEPRALACEVARLRRADRDLVDERGDLGAEGGRERADVADELVWTGRGHAPDR